jgi:hypothetical protein
MYGKTHTQETRVKISASMTGKTHSEETRAKMSDANKGANNPISIQVNVVSAVNNQLEHSFSSQVACGKWLGVSEGTVRNYIKSGKVFRKQYLIVRSGSLAPRVTSLFLGRGGLRGERGNTQDPRFFFFFFFFWFFAGSIHPPFKSI